jgi:uncharacterized protein (TIGR00369 family)
MTDDLLDEDTSFLPEGYRRMNWFRGFGNQIGPLYERIGPGEDYTRAFLVGEHHTNGMMNCHGGMLMAFADTAFGHAVTMRARDNYWVTIRLVCDFIASAKVGDWVEGTGEVAGVEDDIYTIKGRIWCGDNMIMTGTGIFKTVGKRPQKR